MSLLNELYSRHLGRVCCPVVGKQDSVGRQVCPLLLRAGPVSRQEGVMLIATQVLILDEISMISAEMFNALEQMARDLRGSELPFGGIQLILAGDFFQ